VPVADPTGSLTPKAPATPATTGLPPDPMIGRNLLGQYIIRQRLGEGGMGTAYLADQVGMDRLAVVKVLHPHLLGDARWVERFNREAKVASKLNHPNSITLYNYGRTEEGYVYFAMEYVDGRSLSNLIEEEGRLSVERACGIAIQICSALQQAHELGIVHRDMKPDNVLLTWRGKQEIAKVLDFGIAKLQGGNPEEKQLTAAGMIFGTPAYMSPEQFGGGDLDGRSDLYSLGVILYEMLTGRRPFHASSPLGYFRLHQDEIPPPMRVVNPEVNVSRDLERVVFKALEKDRGARFRDAEEMAQELELALASAAVEGNGSDITFNPGESLPGLQRNLPMAAWLDQLERSSHPSQDPLAALPAREPEGISSLLDRLEAEAKGVAAHPAREEPGLHRRRSESGLPSHEALPALPGAASGALGAAGGWELGAERMRQRGGGTAVKRGALSGSTALPAGLGGGAEPSPLGPPLGSADAVDGEALRELTSRSKTPPGPPAAEELRGAGFRRPPSPSREAPVSRSRSVSPSAEPFVLSLDSEPESQRPGLLVAEKPRYSAGEESPSASGGRLNPSSTAVSLSPPPSSGGDLLLGEAGEVSPGASRDAAGAAVTERSSPATGPGAALAEGLSASRDGLLPPASRDGLLPASAPLRTASGALRPAPRPGVRPLVPLPPPPAPADPGRRRLLWIGLLVVALGLFAVFRGSWLLGLLRGTPVEPAATEDVGSALEPGRPGGSAAATATPPTKGPAASSGPDEQSTMVTIPSGSFTMGHASIPGAAPHTVVLPAFAIDRRETTNAEYQPCVAAGECFEPSFLGDPLFNAPELPVVGVSYEDAQTFCRWRGKRLPTEAEWERAARGPEGTLWPWGDRFVAGAANVAGDEDGAAHTAPATAFRRGASPEGVENLAGNVAEWVADSYGAKEAYPRRKGPDPRLDGTDGKARARGGSWASDAENTRTPLRGERLPRDSRKWSIGFRCAGDLPAAGSPPPPAAAP